MALVLFVAGCQRDLDLDGLSDRVERDLGTDPNNPDTDGDTLLDGEEVRLGTDPLSTDSDEDGYLDGDEVFEGIDPADPESRIYQGGWPYLRDKSGIEDASFESQARPGQAVPRFHALDQFGDPVDLADFAMQGHEILIDICGGAYPACTNFAKWRRAEEPFWFLGEVAEPARDRFNAGEVGWVTIMSEGREFFSKPVYQDVVDWSTLHGDGVPILFDDGQVFADWALRHNEIIAKPLFLLLSEDLSIRHIDTAKDIRFYQGFFTFEGVF